MVLIFIAIIAIGFLACVAWWKLCMLLYPKKKASVNNPYIEAHKLKLKNDDLYLRYMDWLDKEGNGVPIPKIQSPEDIEAEKKIKKHYGF